MNQLLYMDDLKLLGRSEDDLENKIKIVKAVVCFLFGNFPGSEFYMPIFWSTLCSILIGG